MRQKTAKSVIDVLTWIEATPHHFASWDDEPGFFIVKGHGEKLRIPEAIQAQTRGLVEPGGTLDARMFRANTNGKRRLARAKQKAATQ